MTRADQLTARDVMRENVITVGAEASLHDAIELLMQHKISGLPVVDAKQRVIGVITEKDMVKLLYEPRGKLKKVGDLMVQKVVSFEVDTPLVEICDCLMSESFRRVPIVDNGKLVGLISRADLMPTLLELSQDSLPPEA